MGEGLPSDMGDFLGKTNLGFEKTGYAPCCFRRCLQEFPRMEKVLPSAQQQAVELFA